MPPVVRRDGPGRAERNPIRPEVARAWRHLSATRDEDGEGLRRAGPPRLAGGRGGRGYPPFPITPLSVAGWARAEPVTRRPQAPPPASYGQALPSTLPLGVAAPIPGTTEMFHP